MRTALACISFLILTAVPFTEAQELKRYYKDVDGDRPGSPGLVLVYDTFDCSGNPIDQIIDECDPKGTIKEVRTSKISPTTGEELDCVAGECCPRIDSNAKWKEKSCNDFCGMLNNPRPGICRVHDVTFKDYAGKDVTRSAGYCHCGPGSEKDSDGDDPFTPGCHGIYYRLNRGYDHPNCGGSANASPRDTRVDLCAAGGKILIEQNAGAPGSDVACAAGACCPELKTRQYDCSTACMTKQMLMTGSADAAQKVFGCCKTTKETCSLDKKDHDMAYCECDMNVCNPPTPTPTPTPIPTYDVEVPTPEITMVSPSPEPRCGNGVLEGGEICDDGNLNDFDSCSSTCIPSMPTVKPSMCGDGIIDPGEMCDDGNYSDLDGCSSTCSPSMPTVKPSMCGDGIIDPGEMCDDGNLSNDDMCLATCQMSWCGDGFCSRASGVR